MVNSRSVRRHNLAGVKCVANRRAIGNLDNETTAPLAKLKCKQVKLVIALAAEMRK
jgi:hypothetical protein